MSTERTRKPQVDVLAMGGTIVMAGDGGVTPQLSSEQLIATVPGLSDIARVSARTFRQLPGASLKLDDLYALAEEIERCFAGGSSGVVVTQGTDTIEETAFCLDLLLDTSRPVVVTGAMRNPTLPGADGPANIKAAVTVAVDESQPEGVVVVLGDEVHAARWVAKSHSTVPSAFCSPGRGPMGIVAEGRYRPNWRLAQSLPKISREFRRSAVSVPVVSIGLDDDGAQLAVGENADAVVLEALGVGHVPAWLVEPIAELAARIPVVMASRTRSGPILHRTYGFPGSEGDLRAKGVLSAGTLDTMKSRILLMVLLRSGASSADVVEYVKQVDALS